MRRICSRPTLLSLGWVALQNQKYTTSMRIKVQAAVLGLTFTHAPLSWGVVMGDDWWLIQVPSELS
jgi:hypothetical protein